MPEKKEMKTRLIINGLGHAFNDSYMFIVPLLLPFLREEFHINYVQSGLVLTAHIAIRSIFSLIFGHFGDTHDKRAIIAGGFISSSILLGGLIWAQSIHIIIAFLLLIAIGVSTFHPLATTIVRENSTKNQIGRNFGLFEAVGAAGAFISSLLFGFFVYLWGWKITCLLISLPGYFLAYAYLKSKRGKKNHKAEAEKKIKQSHIPLFFISKAFQKLGTSIIAFLPFYAIDYIGLRPEISSWSISIFFSGFFLGNLISSRISDKSQPFDLIVSTTIVSAFLILGITFVVRPIIFILLIGILGISQGLYYPSQNTWQTFICPVHSQSGFFGIGLFAEGISATIAPTLYGWIADQISLIGAYRLAAIPVFISFILFLILRSLDNEKDKL
jgi:MFS family permease